jgi:hypothetical protein
MGLGQGQKRLPIEHNAIDALWVYCIKNRDFGPNLSVDYRYALSMIFGYLRK